MRSHVLRVSRATIDEWPRRSGREFSSRLTSTLSVSMSGGDAATGTVGAGGGSDDGLPDVVRETPPVMVLPAAAGSLDEAHGRSLRRFGRLRARVRVALALRRAERELVDLRRRDRPRTL